MQATIGYANFDAGPRQELGAGPGRARDLGFELKEEASLIRPGSDQAINRPGLALFTSMHALSGYERNIRSWFAPYFRGIPD